MVALILPNPKNKQNNMKLRDYQEKIVEQGKYVLSQYKILYLAMEPRTGKTITSLSIAQKCGFRNVLFITKIKAIPSVKKDYDEGGFDFSMILVNHESIHKIQKHLLDQVDLIISDEHHMTGSLPKPSKRAVNLRAIVRDKPIIMLSGTPSPETKSQLYHQFWVSENSPFRSYINFYKWARVFVDVQQKKVNRGLMINDYTKAKERDIDQCTEHLFITFSQKEAGFEQQIQEEVLTCQMGSYINFIRKTLKADLIYTDQDKGFELVADTAVRLQQLDHQLSSGTVIDYNGEYRVLDQSKALFIKEKFAGKRIVIFFKFKAERELLKTVFPNYTEVPEDFQEGLSDTFIGQYQSCREGIRLDTADCIVFFNIDFSSISYFQAKERIMSFERKKDAHLYWIFSENGIEKNIYKAVTKKKDYTLSYYLKDEQIDKKRFREQNTSENY